MFATLQGGHFCGSLRPERLTAVSGQGQHQAFLRPQGCQVAENHGTGILAPGRHQAGALEWGQHPTHEPAHLNCGFAERPAGTIRWCIALVGRGGGSARQTPDRNHYYDECWDGGDPPTFAWLQIISRRRRLGAGWTTGGALFRLLTDDGIRLPLTYLFEHSAESQSTWLAQSTAEQNSLDFTRRTFTCGSSPPPAPPKPWLEWLLRKR